MRILFTGALFLITACYQPPAQKQTFDIIIRNGTIYDGTGSVPFVGDLAIQHDTIVAIGDLGYAVGKKEINATNLAITPGFINMLSWADKNLLKDGTSMSNIKQGVTLEVFGEGWSPGPVKRKTTKPVDSLWTTLGGYFDYLAKKGISPNVASLVGHTTVRNLVLDQDNRAPDPDELLQMKKLVAEAMEEGAMGMGTSLIYPPASYSTTEELIELSKVAAHYGGIYTTHLRSEGDNIFNAVNEAFRISKEANIPVEIYHLKLSLSRNWNKIDTLLFKLDSARNAGLNVSANMYPYVGSGTGLTARLPQWVQEGGGVVMRKKLRNPAMRKKVLYEMEMGIPYKNSDPKDVMLLGFRSDSLNNLYRWKRLDEAARMHGKSADETAIDLIVKDKSRVEAIYFLQSEDNVRKIIQVPYVSFGSDAGSIPITKEFTDGGTHPRTYGTFARVFAEYVRKEKLITWEDAVRRMTSLPAETLHIQKRGALKVGYHADVVVLDTARVQDHATFEDPHQYASGINHVIVNGIPVVFDGEHTGAKPGRIIYGPGKK